jgi:hypothetical protein
MEQVTDAWERAFDVCPDARGPTPAPSPGPSPAPSPSPTGDWFSYNALNCYTSHGATEMDTTPLQVSTVDECRSKCDNLRGCEAITYQYAEGSLKCWRRKNIDLGNCQGGDYATDVKKSVFTQLRIEDSCLDLPGSNPTNGNSLWMWGCENGDNQLWHLSVGELLYAPVPTKCLDIPGGDMSPGNVPEIWDCNGLPQQQVTFAAHLLSLSETDNLCLRRESPLEKNKEHWDVKIAKCDTADAGQEWSLHYGPGAELYVL